MSTSFHTRYLRAHTRLRHDIGAEAYGQALDMCAEGIVFVDDQWTVVRCNPSARRLFGLGAGDRLSDLLDDVDGVMAGDRRIAVVKAGGERIVVRHPPRWSGSAIRPLLLSPLAQSPIERLVSFATRDPGTGLLNQDAFEDALVRCAGQSAGGVGGCAVMVLQIDHFCLVAETACGESTDLLLRVLADRLRRAVPAGALCARLYGGTFAVLCSGADDALEWAEQVKGALGRPMVVNGRTLTVSLSIGVARHPHDAAEGGGVLRAAEIALHAAQATGGGRVRACSPELLARLREEVELDGALQTAIQNGEMRVHYQPKVDWGERRLVGLEALVRWQHPRHGLVAPGRFIPLAERSGLITVLGGWVMEEVCRQLAAWRADGLPLCPVAVNVSPTQLLVQSVDDLLAPLRTHGIPPALIEIEITESAMMDTLQSMGRVLADLRASAVKVAIDDFGTGHSSLGNLRKLPIDVFKIDRSFVIDIERSKEACDIVSTIIAMARTLRLDIVAEGVETETQAAFLADRGARIMQGYLFSRPVAAGTVAHWLKANSLGSGTGGGPPPPCPSTAA